MIIIMTESEAWLALVKFAESQERVTIYRDEDLVWFIEWFNMKGGYKWFSNESLIELVSEVCK